MSENTDNKAQPERIWIDWDEREFHLKPLAGYVEYARVSVDGAAPTVDHDWRWYDTYLRATGYTDLANRMRAEFKPAITHATAAPAEQSDEIYVDYERDPQTGEVFTVQKCAVPSSQLARDAAEEIARTFQHGDVWGKTYQELRDLAHAVITEHFPAAAAPVESEWMPIETAPKGVDILLLWEDEHMQIHHFPVVEKPSFWFENAPIKWRHLPPLPNAAAPVAATGNDEGELQPTSGADGRFCIHHDDDPSHSAECYERPTAEGR